MILRDKGLQEEDFGLLVKEDSDQIAKWGFQELDAFEWLAYTTEELGELSEAISECRYRGGRAEKIVMEAIQTATLALKIAVMAKRQFNLGLTEETIISLLNKQTELIEKETSDLIKGMIDKKEYLDSYYYTLIFHSPVPDYRYGLLSIWTHCYPVLIRLSCDIINELSIDVLRGDLGYLKIYSPDELEEVLKAIFATKKVKSIVEKIVKESKERQDESR